MERSHPAGHSGRAATIWDVAREAATSKSTVSKVLRGHPHVARATRERVRAAIDRLDYRPNAAARSLVQRRADVIGIVVADIRNPFYAEIAHAIAGAAAASGYETVLSDLSTERAGGGSFLDLVAERRADALVLAAWPASAAADARFASAGFPFAFVACRPLDGLAADFVVVDEALGARAVVGHLVELGHRRIACIASSEGDSSAAERLAGYRLGLEKAGLESDPALVVAADAAGVEDDFGSLAGFRAARRLLGVQPRPTAIFAADDFLAIGAMQAIEESGLRIPEDISLVGFDDIALAGLRRIGLTTVEQPRAVMGRRVTELLLRRLSGDPAAEPFGVVLEPRLVVRSSTGPAPTEK